MGILLEIIKNDLHIFLRSFGSWREARLREVVVTVVLGGLFALFLVPACIFGGILLGNKGVESIPYLRLMFTYLFLLVIILSMSFATSAMITNYDLPLLLTSPIEGRTLVLARYLSIWSLFGILVFPLFALFMISFSIAADSFSALIMGSVSFLLMYSSAIMLGIMSSLIITALLSRTSSSKRVLRPFIVLSLMAIIFIFYRLLIVSSEFSVGQETGMLRFIPVAYGADLIFFKTKGLTLVLFSLCIVGTGIVALQRYAIRFWRLREGAPSSRSKGVVTYKELTTSVPLTVEAIISKEAKHLFREPDSMVRLFILAALFISIPLTPVFTTSTIEPQWMVFLIFAMAWASTMVLCANSLGVEGKRLNLLKMSPLRGKHFMLGKWMLATFLTLLFTLVLTLSMAAVEHIPVTTLSLYVLLCFIIAATGSAIGVGVGAYLPDFKRGVKNRPGMNAFMLISILFIISFTPAIMVLATDIEWIFNSHSQAILGGLAITTILGTGFGMLAYHVGVRSFEKVEATDIR